MAGKDIKHQILITDDDPHLRDLLRMVFQDHFDLEFAETAKQCLDLINAHDFQFIILDIHLPDQSGIEVCRNIQQLPEDKQPGIVILSADSDDDVVREAYELDVGDYIVKPFNISTFFERIMRFSRDLDKIKALEDQDSQIQTMAETVMKQAASYGNGLELISRLNSCHSPESLCNEVLQNFLNQGFHCAVQARLPDRNVSIDVDVTECSKIELQIFDLLHSKGRIYTFGQRCIFNDEHVSILVKNMPAQGTQTYDSLVDVAAKLIPAINTRLMSICEHNSLVAAKNSLSAALEMLSEGVSEMEQEKRQLMENIEMQIGLSFHQLDLDEKQEAFFINMVEREIRSRQESGKLDKIQNMISQCVGSITIMEASEEKINSEPEDQGADDIELF